MLTCSVPGRLVWHPQEVVVRRVRVDVESRDRPFQVVGHGVGALVGACARARSIEGCDLTIGSAQEARKFQCRRESNAYSAAELEIDEELGGETLIEELAVPRMNCVMKFIVVPFCSERRWMRRVSKQPRDHTILASTWRQSSAIQQSAGE